MATPFHAELVTPERVLFSGEVDEITLRTDGGDITFLAGHADYIAVVDITVARLSVVGSSEVDNVGSVSSSSHSKTREQNELEAAVHGGFVQVNSTGVTILAGVGELADEIDVDRARLAADSALRDLDNPSGDHSEQASGGGELANMSAAGQAVSDPTSPANRLRRATARLAAAGQSPTT